MRPFSTPVLLSALLVAGASSAQDQWTSGFHLSGVNHSGAPVEVTAATVVDVGSGPALYIAGRFEAAGGALTNSVARWDGSLWSSLEGHPPFSEVRDLLAFNDGGGEDLYAAVPGGVANWDGSGWTLVGSTAGGTGGTVGCSGTFALAVFDDGLAPALFAAGDFTSIDGVPANGIARWDGANWSSLGGGLSGGPVCFDPFGQPDPTPPVVALTVFENGVGDEVLACGGSFTQAGGAPAQHVAQWDGSAWTPIGGGWPNPIEALAAFDDGSGEVLFAAAASVSGPSLQGLIRWDGMLWTSVSTDVGIHDLEVLDDGTGEALFLVGSFDQYAGVASRGIVRWDGTQFSGLAGGVAGDQGEVLAVAAYDEGQGPRLFAFGSFAEVGASAPVEVNHAARWNGTSWSLVGSRGRGATADVTALLTADLGAGEVLLMPYQATFSGNSSPMADPPYSIQLGSWNGSSWAPFAGPLLADQRDPIHALALFDAGTGPEVLAAGTFEEDEHGTPLTSIARWDGSAWQALGLGLDDEPHHMLVWDDGTGPALYVAGEFTEADGLVVRGIARWDGTGFSSLAGGLLHNGFRGNVQALAVWDDGTGPALYAGGAFSHSFAGAPMRNLARWDGTAWSEVGGGLGSTSSTPSVTALQVFDDGGGADLYVGGPFTSVGPVMGGLFANRIARWDGSAWSSLGSGLSSEPLALTTWFDGTTERLVAGGQISDGGVNRLSAYRWNGINWRPLGVQVRHRIEAMAPFDDGIAGRPALYVGGRIHEAGLRPSSGLARYGAQWAAAAVPRNGSGLNRLCYTSTTLPALGQEWVTEVDHAAHPGAVSTLLVGKAQPTTLPFHLGEVLVSGPRLFRHALPSSGVSDTHVVTIPLDVSLAGVSIPTQALILGGGLELCNALDLVFGF